MFKILKQETQLIRKPIMIDKKVSFKPLFFVAFYFVKNDFRKYKRGGK
jgi:hypothetical protein